MTNREVLSFQKIISNLENNLIIGSENIKNSIQSIIPETFSFLEYINRNLHNEDISENKVNINYFPELYTLLINKFIQFFRSVNKSSKDFIIIYDIFNSLLIPYAEMVFQSNIMKPQLLKDNLSYSACLIVYSYKLFEELNLSSICKKTKDALDNVFDNSDELYRKLIVSVYGCFDNVMAQVNTFLKLRFYEIKEENVLLLYSVTERFNDTLINCISKIDPGPESIRQYIRELKGITLELEDFLKNLKDLSEIFNLRKLIIKLLQEANNFNFVDKMFCLKADEYQTNLYKVIHRYLREQVSYIHQVFPKQAHLEEFFSKFGKVFKVSDAANRKEFLQRFFDVYSSFTDFGARLNTHNKMKEMVQRAPEPLDFIKYSGESIEYIVNLYKVQEKLQNMVGFEKNSEFAALINNSNYYFSIYFMKSISDIMNKRLVIIDHESNLECKYTIYKEVIDVLTKYLREIMGFSYLFECSPRVHILLYFFEIIRQIMRQEDHREFFEVLNLLYEHFPNLSYFRHLFNTDSLKTKLSDSVSELFDSFMEIESDINYNNTGSPPEKFALSNRFQSKLNTVSSICNSLPILSDTINTYNLLLSFFPKRPAESPYANRDEVDEFINDAKRLAFILTYRPKYLFLSKNIINNITSIFPKVFQCDSSKARGYQKEITTITPLFNSMINEGLVNFGKLRYKIYLYGSLSPINKNKANHLINILNDIFDIISESFKRYSLKIQQIGHKMDLFYRTIIATFGKKGNEILDIWTKISNFINVYKATFEYCEVQETEPQTLIHVLYINLYGAYVDSIKDEFYSADLKLFFWKMVHTFPDLTKKISANLVRDSLYSLIQAREFLISARLLPFKNIVPSYLCELAFLIYLVFSSDLSPIVKMINDVYSIITEFDLSLKLEEQLYNIDSIKFMINNINNLLKVDKLLTSKKYTEKITVIIDSINNMIDEFVSTLYFIEIVRVTEDSLFFLGNDILWQAGLPAFGDADFDITKSIDLPILPYDKELPSLLKLCKDMYDYACKCDSDEAMVQVKQEVEELYSALRKGSDQTGIQFLESYTEITNDYDRLDKKLVDIRNQREILDKIIEKFSAKLENYQKRESQVPTFLNLVVKFHKTFLEMNRKVWDANIQSKEMINISIQKEFYKKKLEMLKPNVNSDNSSDFDKKGEVSTKVEDDDEEDDASIPQMIKAINTLIETNANLKKQLCEKQQILEIIENKTLSDEEVERLSEEKIRELRNMLQFNSDDNVSNEKDEKNARFNDERLFDAFEEYRKLLSTGSKSEINSKAHELSNLLFISIGLYTRQLERTYRHQILKRFDEHFTK